MDALGVLSIATLAGTYSVDGMSVLSANQSMEDDTTTQLTSYTKVMEASRTPVPDGIVPDVIMALLLIGGCAVVGYLIAKLADVIYDKYVSKRTKDTSKGDAARKLLRARVAIMRMKPDPKSPYGSVTKRAAVKWMAKTSDRKTNAVNPQPVETLDKPTLPGIKASPQATKTAAQPTTSSQTPIISITGSSATKPDSAAADALAAKPRADTEHLHPLETMDFKIKPSGPLPPVVVHDVPKSN